MIQQLCLQRYSARGLIALDTLNLKKKKYLKEKSLLIYRWGLSVLGGPV